MVALNELKLILEVRAQKEQSNLVNKASVESLTQNNFREVRRCKRHVFNDTSHTNNKLTKPVPTSTAVKLPPKAVLARNFFAPLRTLDMDAQTTGAETAPPEQKAPRKSGRLPATVMTSTTRLIRLQSNTKDHTNGQYKSQNTKNRTCIKRKKWQTIQS
jgi:hypothetical protein